MLAGSAFAIAIMVLWLPSIMQHPAWMALQKEMLQHLYTSVDAAGCVMPAALQRTGFSGAHLCMLAALPVPLRCRCCCPACSHTLCTQCTPDCRSPARPAPSPLRSAACWAAGSSLCTMPVREQQTAQSVLQGSRKWRLRKLPGATACHYRPLSILCHAADSAALPTSDLPVDQCSCCVLCCRFCCTACM